MSQLVPRAARLAHVSCATASTLRLPVSARAFYSSSPPLPSVAQASFWKSLVPKPFRRENRSKSKDKGKSKEWNPATFYIVLFTLIGSMSINMLASKQDFEKTIRRADAKIGALRDVVEKIQRGEEVDVEKALGTGDPVREAEWEDILQEIVREDISRNQRKQAKARQPTPGSQKNKKPEAPSGEQATSPSKRSSADADFY